MMLKKPVFLFVALLTLISVFFTACSSNVQPADNDVNKPVVYRTTGSKISTLNPHVYQLSAERTDMDRIYSSLYFAIVDPETKNLKFVPYDAAEEPVINEDSSVWSFKIKKDLLWEDGDVLDANDYEYSYKMLLDPKLKNSRATSLFGGALVIKNAEQYWKGEVTWDKVGIKAIDNTLQLTFKYPTPKIDVMSAFSYSGPLSPVNERLYSGGMNDDKTETNYATSLETISSSGIFVMTEWIRDQNKEFDKRLKTPLSDYITVDKVTVRIVNSSSTKLQLFENNETDYVSLSGKNYDKYSDDPRVIFSEATGVRCMYINMENQKKPFLTDINFRQAMFWAMNRESIAKNIYKTAIPATYIIATGGIVDIDNGLRYRDTEPAKSVLVQDNGFNQDKAVEYFNKAYKKYGKQMVVELQYFEGSDSMKNMAEYVEESFQNLFGPDKLDIKLRAVPTSSVYQNMRDGKYEMAFGRWNAGRFNPWSFLTIHTSDHTGKLDRMRNKEFDLLLERCLTGDLLLKSQERIEALAELEKIMLSELPKIPIYEDRYASMIHDRITLITDGRYVPGVGFGVLQSDFAELD